MFLWTEEQERRLYTEEDKDWDKVTLSPLYFFLF